ncbi:hypothetical protein VTK26DRAFT_9163 [Humicola hyalothermophila]
MGQFALNPASLPNLRILKVQGREMDDTTAALLFKTFKSQLWSVDLSRNKLSDGMLDEIHNSSFPAGIARTGDFSVEGGLTYPPGEGSALFGKFCFVNESQWSASFSHPHRYLADAPVYTRHAQAGIHGDTSLRLDGRMSICLDSADRVKEALAGRPGSHSPQMDVIHGLDICRGAQGITHLYLNGNDISAAALVRMIRSSPGHLHHLECDTVSFKVHEAASRSWPLSKYSLSGILGSAHVFRPVISPNLQVLRIHHSLVTQLLSLEAENVTAMSNWWLAETYLLPRAELAYPVPFVPDMNPRLQSLVLTQIPRYSTGPLIEKLINFLKLASIQERTIHEIKVANRRRGPMLLLGLRHLRLEFQHDPREALENDPGDEDDLDPAEALDTSKEFSFFGDSGWSSTRLRTDKPPASAMASPPVVNTPRSAPEPRDTNQNNNQSGRLERFPSPEAETGQQRHSPSEHRTCTWTWNATDITVPVWIGPAGHLDPDDNDGNRHHTPAVREYARLLRSDPRLRADPVPASPSHVAAGVPPGSYVFSAAWDAIVLAPPAASSPSSPSLLRPSPLQSPTGTSTSIRTAAAPPCVPELREPTRAELRGMRDVVAAIKEYRARTRAAYAAARKRGTSTEGEQGEPHFHFHWTGRLEVSMADAAAGAMGRYWR